MCGIVAVLKSRELDLPLSVVRSAAEEVAHRGPDGAGLVGLGAGAPLREISSTGWRLGLGFRRLAIIDLSEAGNQPMECLGRYWLIYNGEIFNYVELRSELEKLGHHFRSRSDSEVILASFAEWGQECFARFRGMWGLVLYDAMREEVTLSRDHLCIKPLYLWRSGGILAVASEIKQFSRIPGFRARTDEDVAWEYLETGNEDPDRSFFDGIAPLPAGTSLRIPLNKLDGGHSVIHWSPEKVPVSVVDTHEAARLFASKFEECVRIHFRSDVPVGCALSGGLDSSSISVTVDAVRPLDEGPLFTFSVTFPGDTSDEREYFDVVIRRIRALPHFDTPTPERFLQDLRDFVWHQDEPVGGLSIYAGYSLARLIRQAGVPVTLNGQGGDEILGGYWQSYFLYLRELFLQGRFLDLASHLGGAGRCVNIVGPLGRILSLRRLVQSDLLLLLAEGLTLQIPGKTYEYLRAGRPILALTSGGALADLLRKTGGAWVVDPVNDNAVLGALREAYHGWNDGAVAPEPDRAVVADFDRR